MNNDTSHIQGWVRRIRNHGKVIFIEIHYGHTKTQIVLKEQKISILPGSFIQASGFYQVLNNKSEFVASSIQTLSPASCHYPIQNKECSLEFLRTQLHLRHRTKLFDAVNKIRNQLNFSIHTFLNQEGFIWTPTPIMTSNNCEGGSDVFGLNNPNFFNEPVFLSVSGQLHLEAFAIGLGKVYTFGPTFRAEKSNSKHHLAEFWMLELEMHGWGLNEMMDLIEKLLKYLFKDVLYSCKAELMQIEEVTKKDIINNLVHISEIPYSRKEYKDVIEELGVDFGWEITKEQEKNISKAVPTFITNHPTSSKPFYMKENNNPTTVASLDLVFSDIGELVGGSERKNNYQEVLDKLSHDPSLVKTLGWYTSLRQYGYYESAGFGLGFERLLSVITQLENLKDLIPLPISYKSSIF